MTWDIGAWEYGSATPIITGPSADISVGTWTPSTGGTLFSCIDEDIHSATDYISTTTTSTCEVQFPPTVFPGGSVEYIAYWARSTSGNGITVTLRQSGATIASWSHSLTATDTLYTQTLTSGEIASITDPSVNPLSVQLTST